MKMTTERAQWLERVRTNAEAITSASRYANLDTRYAEELTARIRWMEKVLEQEPIR